MQNDRSKLLSELIDSAEEHELSQMLKNALLIHMAHLLRQREEIEREITQTEAQLKGLGGDSKGRPAAPSKLRIAERIRQVLRDAGRPLPLDGITHAVSKATGRPLTNSLRAHVAHLISREPSITRLTNGMYAIRF
jgi:hypothetical protein